VMITAIEHMLSPQEAGDRLGVSVYTVRRWIKAGELKAYKPKKEYRIAEADLQRFLEDNQAGPLAPAPLLSDDPQAARRLPTDSEIKCLGRWLTYLERRLNESDLTLDELNHELDALGSMAIRHAPTEYPDEISNKFLRLGRRTLEEVKSFAALQTEAAELAADLDRLEEIHAQAQERQA
jgi:excisionase family DNA binding protein